MTDLPFRKLYVDTRFKTTDSISNSDFKFQLGRPASMPANTTFCVDEINIPHSWNTIETGINDKLYVSWATSNNPLVYATLVIPQKRYNGSELSTQIQTQLNGAGFSGWTVVYDQTLNLMIVSGNLTAFKLWTDDDLTKNVIEAKRFTGLNASNPQSVNEILQITGLTGGTIGGQVNSVAKPFTSGFLNLIHFQDLYLTSGSLGSFDTQGVRGESSIIRKICVNAAWGYSIIDKLSWDSDHLSCSKIALSTIDFQLRDVKGRIVPLHGAHVSFTLKFREN